MPKSGQRLVYNWPQHRLKYGRGSEKPAAHTQQKMTHVPPSGGFTSYTQVLKFLYLQWLILLSFFFEHLSLMIATLQLYISLQVYQRVGHRRPLINYALEVPVVNRKGILHSDWLSGRDFPL